MAKAYIFPSLGVQFVGMGKDLYKSNKQAQLLFDKANEVFGIASPTSCSMVRMRD